MNHGVMWRREGEALRAREAKRCETEGHLTGFWHFGDFATPDRLVCPRCYVELATRPHGPSTPEESLPK